MWWGIFYKFININKIKCIYIKILKVMAFIDKENPVVLNIMLTSKGREQISKGALTFNYFSIGDSEIDYNFVDTINNMIEDEVNDFNPFYSSILKPTDNYPKILSHIVKTATGETFNNFVSQTQSIKADTVVNTAQEIGFFSNNNTEFITDSNHVKQPDAMVMVSGITGGTSLSLIKAPTYGSSSEEPTNGDFLLIKWTTNTDTTGHTINQNYPSQYLMYRITGVTGSLNAENIVVSVDRELPNYSGHSVTGLAGALIYYSGNTALENTTGTDYLIESVLTFLQNYQCSIDAFPYWNMSIIFTEEIAGIQNVDKKYAQFNTRSYGGFVNYIQNQAPINKKLGVIHYSNSTPANVYGESFNLNTPILNLPTIMWHKSTGTTIGLTLAPTGSSKILTGETKSLDIRYYDLADPYGNIVGKVFNSLKLFVIEDQELLFAMSYKANRSWTLPNYRISNASANYCDGSTTKSTIDDNDYTIFMSYILVPETLTIGNGNSKYAHCNYFNSIKLNTSNISIENIVFNFLNSDDFTFLSTEISGGTGYTTTKIYGLVQLIKNSENSGFTSNGIVTPIASEWKIVDLTTQITGHVSGDTLTVGELTNQTFNIPLSGYSSFDIYNLHDFIKYPTATYDGTNLSFGEEHFFFGNVTTDIEAVVYTTDLSIILGLNEFNLSTNETWNNTGSVYISEVGIYDLNYNLVAIGKLNNPIEKNSSISRTIVFEVDF